MPSRTGSRASTERPASSPAVAANATAYPKLMLHIWLEALPVGSGGLYLDQAVSGPQAELRQDQQLADNVGVVGLDLGEQCCRGFG